VRAQLSFSPDSRTVHFPALKDETIPIFATYQKQYVGAMAAAFSPFSRKGSTKKKQISSDILRDLISYILPIGDTAQLQPRLS